MMNKYCSFETEERDRQKLGNSTSIHNISGNSYII